jgi:hypothetical protein
LLDNYRLVDSAALPNYVAMVSGQAPNPSTQAECTTYSEFPSGSQPDTQGNVPGSGCVYPVQALSIADQVTSGRLTWGAYMEGMGQGSTSQTCVKPAGNGSDTATGQDGGYATRHNPFVYFHSLLDLGDCSSYDVSLDKLPGSLKRAKTTPNYVFISPNFCNSGSVSPCPNGDPGGPASADQFLSQWAPQILNSAAYKKDGVLIVTFGQKLPADSADPNPNVGTLLVSHFLPAGSTSTAAYNSYSLLRSTEDLFGVSTLAQAGTATSFASQLLGKSGTAAAGAGDRTKRAG